MEISTFGGISNCTVILRLSCELYMYIILRHGVNVTCIDREEQSNFLAKYSEVNYIQDIKLKNPSACVFVFWNTLEGTVARRRNERRNRNTIYHQYERTGRQKERIIPERGGGERTSWTSISVRSETLLNFNRNH